jgi:hypothetical protein
MVLAPLVFTCWTTRHFRELLECWDIPSCLVQDFETITTNDYERLPFILSPPVKVLYGMLASIKKPEV